VLVPVVGGIVVEEDPLPVNPLDKNDAPGTIPEPQPVRTTLADTHNNHRDRPTLREDPIVRIMLPNKSSYRSRRIKESPASPTNATSTEGSDTRRRTPLKKHGEKSNRKALRLRRYRKISAGGIE